MTPTPCNIVVVATKHRPPLITEYMDAGEYNISYTPDYLVPDERNWPWDWLNHNTAGSYRCSRGHQDALRLVPADQVALVFEDDAVPNRDDWRRIAVQAIPLLEHYDVVSLHARRIRNGKLNRTMLPLHVNIEDSRTASHGKIFNGKWALGSLAYLVGPVGRNKIIEHQYDGLPVDLFLVNRMKAAIIDPSPFDHDRQFGSVLERAV